MNIGIPVFLSSKGYGILSATSGVSIFNDNEYGSYLYTDADVELDYYFIYGPSFDEIIRGYRALTGKASVLPKWAFGFIQSQERYETQEEILEVVREYRDRGLALDCIVLDWLSWGDGKWGEKIFDETRFPDVEGMVTSLEEMGTHFMMSIWPNMNEETQNYKEFAEKGLLLPGCGIYDAFNEQARDLYWDQVKRGLYGRGEIGRAHV